MTYTKTSYKSCVNARESMFWSSILIPFWIRFGPWSLEGVWEGPWDHMTYPKASISTSLAPRLATLGTAGAPFGYPGAPLWHPLDTPWRPPPPCWDRVSKNVKKNTTFSYIFGLFSDKVHMQSDRAGAVQTHIRQLFLTLVFKPRKAVTSFSTRELSRALPSRCDR